MTTLLTQLDKAGLTLEFFETLINDTEIPEKLRRQVWTMCSTQHDYIEGTIYGIVDSFVVSDDASDLTVKWQALVDANWHKILNCGLKKEIDAIGSLK